MRQPPQPRRMRGSALALLLLVALALLGLAALAAAPTDFDNATPLGNELRQ